MSNQPLLAIDIGNTTIALAYMQQGQVKSVIKIDTSDNPAVLKKSLSAAIKKVCQTRPSPEIAAICSVVPKCTVLVEQMIHKILQIETKVVGRDITVPMKNCYKNPKQVGQDRLVGAYAAMRLYGHFSGQGLGRPVGQRESGLVGRPLIVVDLGTAITFDVVSAKGEYLGGIIVPGLRLSAEALFKKTALLPEIDLKAPKNPIGTTTQESILSGLFYGYGTMCQGLITLLSNQLSSQEELSSLRKQGSSSIIVVMTGGHTDIMKNFVSPKIRIIDPNLVFKGIYFLISL